MNPFRVGIFTLLLLTTWAAPRTNTGASLQIRGLPANQVGTRTRGSDGKDKTSPAQPQVPDSQIEARKCAADCWDDWVGLPQTTSLSVTLCCHLSRADVPCRRNLEKCNSGRQRILIIHGYCSRTGIYTGMLSVPTSALGNIKYNWLRSPQIYPSNERNLKRRRPQNRQNRKRVDQGPLETERMRRTGKVAMVSSPRRRQRRQDLSRMASGVGLPR